MVRKIKAKLILQLRAEGLSGRAIAVSQSMSRRSIAAVVDAADRAGVSWDDIAEKSDDEEYDLLFPGRGQHDRVKSDGVVFLPFVETNSVMASGTSTCLVL